MLGWQEVILVFILLLFVFGPTKLPKLARELGKAMREFNKAASDIKEELYNTSPDLVNAVRPSPTATSRSTQRTVDKWKRDKALSDIAEKLNVDTEGKTNEQIGQEIIEKIENREKPSTNKIVKR